MGIESANQRILDIYNKRITLELSRQAVNTARRAGMDVVLGTFILGAPGETYEEILHTVEFATKLDIDLPQLNRLVANNGLPIWDRLVMDGYVDPDKHWKTGVQVADVCPGNLSSQQLDAIIAYAYDKFFLRIGYVAKEIFRFATSRLRLEMLIRNLTSGNALSRFLRRQTFSEN